MQGCVSAYSLLSAHRKPPDLAMLLIGFVGFDHGLSHLHQLTHYAQGQRRRPPSGGCRYPSTSSTDTAADAQRATRTKGQRTERVLGGDLWGGFRGRSTCTACITSWHLGRCAFRHAAMRLPGVRGSLALVSGGEPGANRKYVVVTGSARHRS